MRRARLDDAGALCGQRHRLLDRAVAQVVAVHPAAARVGRTMGTGEHPLPTPGPRRLRVLQVQRAGQPHRAEALGEITLMQRTRASELLLQGRDQVLRQHRHPVLGALAVAHDDLAPRELDILDTQAQTLEQSHAGAVEQRGQQARGAAHLGEQRPHFQRRQHHRQAARGLGGDDVVEPRQLKTQRGPVEKEQSRLRLPLRCRRDTAFDRQVREKRGDLRGAEFPRVTLAVEDDEAADPVDVGAFGTHRVVAQANLGSDLVEQARFRRCSGRSGCASVAGRCDLERPGLLQRRRPPHRIANPALISILRHRRRAAMVTGCRMEPEGRSIHAPESRRPMQTPTSPIQVERWGRPDGGVSEAETAFARRSLSALCRWMPPEWTHFRGRAEWVHTALN